MIERATCRHRRCKQVIFRHPGDEWRHAATESVHCGGMTATTKAEPVGERVEQ
jgi:hypothetical protein